MKNLTTMLTSSTMLAGLFAATTALADDVKLRYSIWDQSQAAAFNDIIDMFEAENPGIDVELQVTPMQGGKYWTKLQTEAGNSNLPDVFWMNPFSFPLYASQGVVMPIDEMAAASGFDVEAIPQSMRDIYSLDGKLYSLPNNRDAIVVWYNTEMFAEAGVELPQDGWTWADFADKAAALTDADAGEWGTAVYLNDRQVFINTIYQAGGEILSADKKTAQWDSEAALAGTKYMLDIAEAGSSPSLQQIADTGQNALFLSGKVAMLYAGSWVGVTFAESDMAKAGNLGVAELPAGPANNAASTSSLGNMIAADAKHPEEAYKFVEFLASKKAADIYTKAGIALSAYPEFDQNFVDYFAGNFDAKPITDQIGNVFSIPVSFNSNVWRKEINAQLGPVFLGEKPLEEGLEALQSAMQSALDSEIR